MTPSRADLSRLIELQRLFRDTIDGVDPEAPMPWGGRWRVRNLVNHLARVHHWAAGQAARRGEEPLGRGIISSAGGYGHHADALAAVLKELDPAARAWTLLDDGIPKGKQAGTVSFWDRRQKLETLIHLWDLCSAGGLELDVEDELWSDCVAEVVEVMHPRQVRLGRAVPPKVAVAFAAGADAWELAGAPTDAPTVTIHGTPRELALVCWGRMALTELHVTGDRAEASAVLDAGLTP